MPAEPRARAKIDYGIDAPGVIAWLGFGGLAIFVATPILRPWVRLHGFYLWGACWMATAMLMLAYAKIGKFRHRERILDEARLSGGELVLDVGTGRGLLAIGAAKRLTTGRAVGIDIFQKSDLSGNALDKTLENVGLEGVGARCEIRHEDARTLALADGSVDVVVSNLCLHNIHPRKERERALAEIARVLKPGGRAVISDFIATWQYAAFFRAHGFSVTRRAYPLDTFPPLRIVVAEKPVGA
ncbi:MAG TPA: class I SAM-dependent methyltransferase [Polyangia bacterium]